MSLDPKTIYVAQRNDDGTAWREVYLSGSGLILQTDSSGYLTASVEIPSSITIISSSYSTSASFSTSSSYSRTSSYSTTSISASYSTSASFSNKSISSSYSDFAISASYAQTSSYAVSASKAFLANFATTAITASYVFSSVSSSYAVSSSHSNLSDSSSFSVKSISSSYSDFSISASYAQTASYAVSAGYSVSSSHSNISESSSFSNKSISASYSISSSFSDFAISASYSNSSSFSETSISAISSSHSVYSDTASFINYINVDTIGSNWISSSAQFTPSDVFNVGTITASAIQVTNLSVVNVTSSVVYSSGSNIFGNNLINTQIFTGSVNITGSLTVNGEVNVGTINGTASYSIQSATASYLIDGVTIDTGSFVVTASGALTNKTASYSLTSSYINNSGTSNGYLIGTPLDGYYGPGITGSIANIAQGDRVEDALDKVENILAKLAPSRPPNLSTKTLSLVGAYTANIESTNTTIATVTISATPTFLLSGGMIASNAFSDGDIGQLSASINGTNIGSHLLTISDDTGIYGGLQITSDSDFYVGVSGKAGFWKALLAQIVVTTPMLTVGPHTAQLQHTQTGNTPNTTFYIDDPITPTFVTGSIVATGSVYISGVPALVGGQSGSAVTLSATASKTVGRFYNSTHIFQGSGTGITTSNFSLPSSPIASSIQSGSRIISINNGNISENSSFTITAFNSIGATSTFPLSNTHIRLDSTLDGSTRVMSGQGQYPTFGFVDSTFGRSFESSASCVNSGNEELQMLNGQYQYPTGNYTSSLPISGPDYSIVPVGTYNNFRWATFNAGTATSNTNVTVNFSNVTGFSGTLMSNFKLYVQIGPGGSPGTNGWVDGNSAFPGTGNPSNNGDPALVVAGSTTTSKLITFGTSVKSGNVFIRVGIPASDSKKFGSISVIVS